MDFETLVFYHNTTWRHNSEDCEFNLLRCWNVKSRHINICLDRVGKIMATFPASHFNFNSWVTCHKHFSTSLVSIRPRYKSGRFASCHAFSYAFPLKLLMVHILRLPNPFGITKNSWLISTTQYVTTALFKFEGKGAVKLSMFLTRYYAMKTYWCTGIAPCILNLGTRWRCVVSFTPGLESPVPTWQEAGWAPDSVWT
jgi:hypothetical protein